MQQANRKRRATSLLANPTFPSLYVWAVTLAEPSSREGAGVGARSCAVLALGACVAAGVLAVPSPTWSRRVGIYGFVGLSVACWLFLGSSHLGASSLRLVLGSLGWVAFAFGWGVVRELGSIPEEHPAAIAGERLAARGALPWRAPLGLMLSLLAAALCLLLPWRIDRMPHAALGHILGLVAAGSLLIAGGRLATASSTTRASVGPVALRLRNASVPLALLCVLLVLGWIQSWWAGG